jgi:hypothetical protein
MQPAFQPIEAPRSAAAYRDSRADGGERDVTLTPGEVTIGRRLRGVRMKIRVPTQAYRGIVLELQALSSGRLCYTITLRHADGDLDVALHETFEEPEALAMWRAWAKHLSVPLFVARPDGRLQRFAPQTHGEHRGRRAQGVATKRSRGRFQRRRRVGGEISDAVSHKGEREIICYE